MSSDVNQQLFELVKNQQTFAIVIKEQWTADDLSCALAWQLFLSSQNKTANIYCSGKKPDTRFNFLNIEDKLLGKLLGYHYQINIDVSQSGVNELSYSVEDKTLKIFITPTHGTITESDIHFQPITSLINTLICIGMDEPAKAGNIFNEQSEIFYNLPIINIDFQPENIKYGTINVIDITACSNSEITFNIFNDLNPDYITKDIATALLTGIIDSTQSFLRGKISPKTLKSAGQLMEKGADRKKIITQLYQTKTVQQLRLWGSALKELTEYAHGKLLVSQIDWENNIELEKITGIVDELLINNQSTKIAILILKQADGKQTMVISSKKSYQILSSLGYNSSGKNTVIELDSSQKPEDIINKIVSQLEEL